MIEGAIAGCRFGVRRGIREKTVAGGIHERLTAVKETEKERKEECSCIVIMV